MIAVIVELNPTIASYGISLSLSLIAILTLPPVAWKNDPCGRESRIVAPAWTMAAAERLFTLAATRVSAKVFDAMVDPAVVEAVAAAISSPESGARMNGSRFRASIIDIISVCRWEFEMIPESVPVPISRAHTPITLENP